MVKRRAQPIQRDILDIASEQLGDPEASIVFGALLDAAIRSLHPLYHQHPRRVEVLNQALDRIYVELTDPRKDSTEPFRPAVEAYRLTRRPAPALKP